jgi:hypothetical protein
MRSSPLAMGAMMCDRSHLGDAADARARRAARSAGLVARKSRWRANTIDNHGGFMLVDPDTNFCVAGPRWNMTAEDVLEFCDERAES